jgi:hypothetical protein
MRRCLNWKVWNPRFAVGVGSGKWEGSLGHFGNSATF